MENLSLYQITSSFPKLIEEEMSEEDKKEVKKELTELLQQKSQNLIGYIRNIELTIEAMKNEEKRISEQRKILESRLTKFKEYVKECMEQNGFTKIETQLGALSIAKNPISVEIYDEAQIPDEYKTKVIEIKVDKTAIKKALKETGEIIPGTMIIDNKTSLRIK
jgi:predicted metal-binding transcription factor (methanogenesis marker protein 9)